MADWASLPADLINRIADVLLASDELDYYMDFRAFCHTWRSSTADPKAHPLDPLFRPRRWLVLDEVHQSDDARLLVNASTGRFVRKEMPLLRKYLFVAGAAGGLFVVAKRSPPHAVRVLNPFTGSLIRFKASVPRTEMKVAAHVIGSTLSLFYRNCTTFYRAYPDSESFQLCENDVSLAVVDGLIAATRLNGSFAAVTLVDNLLSQLPLVLLPTMEQDDVTRYFLVESEGEFQLVVPFSNAIRVFKINNNANVLEPVKDLGRAFFVGECRCLSVPLWMPVSLHLSKPTAYTTSTKLMVITHSTFVSTT